MFMTDGPSSIEGDGQKYLPWGLIGGADGAAGGLVLNPDSPEQRELPSMISNLTLRKGNTLRTVSPCGGGYGNPLERKLASVLEDFLDGLISTEKAAEQYKGVINQQNE